mmetsp:Transcript_7047/g.17498  ORF Transcript_7047/g.17498 Transcript_7047/m.17498 type:complete len:290 (+) Transcript_7047:1139-2008(+)
MRAWCAPSLARQASPRMRSPKTSAAPTSSSVMRMSWSGRGLPRVSASSHNRTRSKVGQSMSTLASARNIAAGAGAVAVVGAVVGAVLVSSGLAAAAAAALAVAAAAVAACAAAALSLAARTAVCCDRPSSSCCCCCRSQASRLPLLVPAVPPAAPASRMARVREMHGRRSRRCTGNCSPSLVCTVTSSAAAAAERSAASPRTLDLHTRSPPPAVVTVAASTAAAAAAVTPISRPPPLPLAEEYSRVASNSASVSVSVFKSVPMVGVHVTPLSSPSAWRYTTVSGVTSPR